MQESVQGESILETPFCLSMSRYVFRFATRLQITTSLVIRLQISDASSDYDFHCTTNTLSCLCRVVTGFQVGIHSSMGTPFTSHCHNVVLVLVVGLRNPRAAFQCLVNSNLASPLVCRSAVISLVSHLTTVTSPSNTISLV